MEKIKGNYSRHEQLAQIRVLASNIPKEAKTKHAIKQRQALAIEMLKADPFATNKQIRDAAVAKFGVGVSAGSLTKIRRSIKKREAKDLARAESAPQAAAENSDSRSTQSDLHAAVDLIFNAIPNLLTFGVTVTENGDVDVSYTIKEVKVVKTSGNLKVKR